MRDALVAAGETRRTGDSVDRSRFPLVPTMGENEPSIRARSPQRAHGVDDDGGGRQMAAMKPRTGDGPLEVTKEGRGIVMRVPLEGGGRLVVEMSAEEASDLGDALKAASG